MEVEKWGEKRKRRKTVSVKILGLVQCDATTTAPTIVHILAPACSKSQEKKKKKNRTLGTFNYPDWGLLHGLFFLSLLVISIASEMTRNFENWERTKDSFYI